MIVSFHLFAFLVNEYFTPEWQKNVHCGSWGWTSFVLHSWSLEYLQRVWRHPLRGNAIFTTLWKMKCLITIFTTRWKTKCLIKIFTTRWKKKYLITIFTTRWKIKIFTTRWKMKCLITIFTTRWKMKCPNLQKFSLVWRHPLREMPFPNLQKGSVKFGVTLQKKRVSNRCNLLHRFPWWFFIFPMKVLIGTAQ